MNKTAFFTVLATAAIGLLVLGWYTSWSSQATTSALEAPRSPDLTGGVKGIDGTATPQRPDDIGRQVLPSERHGATVTLENVHRDEEVAMLTSEGHNLVWDRDKPPLPPLRDGLRLFAALENESAVEPSEFSTGDFATYFIEGDLFTGFYDREGTTVAVMGALKHGRRDGQWSYYFTNGSSMLVGNFDNGVPVGERTAWAEDGRLEYQQVFSRAGQLHGTCLYYDADGALFAESGVYNDGVLVKAMGH